MIDSIEEPSITASLNFIYKLMCEDTETAFDIKETEKQDWHFK